MDVIAWLEEIPQGETLKRGEVLADLVLRNGGRLEVTGWGVISSGGPLGQVGLHQDEALALLEMGAFFRGFCEGRGEKSQGIEWLRAQMTALVTARQRTMAGDSARLP